MRNTLLNAGIALRAIRKSPTARNGTTITNIVERLPPMIYAIMIEKISMNGQRIAILMIIMKAICTFPTSVVILVTRDEEENLSMLANEYFSMHSYIS